MVLAVPGDIAQPGVGQRIVDAALERFGRIKTVVNNAGIFIAKPFTEYTDDDYDAITGVNLRGFFEVSRAAVSAMLARGEGGHLVNISTSLADNPNSAVPAALASLTKGGLNAVTKELAIEYAKHGIRCNAVLSATFAPPCTTRRPTKHWPRCIHWGAWATSTMSSRRCCTWRTRPSSPARSCTWTVVKVPDTDGLRDALERWKAGIDAQQPERVSEVFTQDAISGACAPTALAAKELSTTTRPNHQA